MAEMDTTSRNHIMTMKTDVLTVEEVADRMRIPHSTARKLAAKTDVDFPRSFKVGKHRRWSEDTVNRYMNGDADARA